MNASRSKRNALSVVSLALSSALLQQAIGFDQANAQSFTYAGPAQYITPGMGAFTQVNWSTTNWIGGVPTSSPTTTLNFSNVDNYGYTTLNDLGAPFTLNRINFTNYGVQTISVTNYGPPSPGTIQTLRFDGTNPTLNLTGTGGVVIGSISGGRTGTSITLNQNLTIAGTGNSLLTLMGSSAAIGGTGALVINRPSQFGIVTVFGDNNSNTGGIILNQGTLQFGSAKTTGNGSLTINGGVIGSSGNIQAANNVTANANLVFGVGNLTLTGRVSGAGGVTVLNGDNYISQALTLGTANTYTGPTTIQNAKPGYTSLNPRGGLTLGSTGTISSLQPVTIGSAGTLTLVGWSNNTRIPDSVAINIDNGELVHTGTASGSFNFAETFGPLQTSGAAVISANPSFSTTLRFGALTRVNKSTLFVRGQLRGTTDESLSITFTGGLSGAISDPTGPSGGVGTAVIPWISGSTNVTSLAPAGVAVYDSVGGLRFLRPLDPTYFVQLDQGSTFDSSTQGSNVNLLQTMTSVTVTGSNRINAVSVSSSKRFNGDGTLTVYSGAVYFNGGITIFNGPTLDFGGNTGYIHLGAADTIGAVCNININGTSAVTGSNGVVVTAPPRNTNNLDLRLQFANSSNNFTGGLFINGGATVAFTNNAQLGAPGQPITLDGGKLVLNPFPTVNATVDRPLTVGRAGGSIGPGGGVPNSITYTGTISGPGTLGIGGGFPAPGVVALTANNNYAGDTIVNSTTLAISGPQNLGQGILILNQGQLRADDFFTYSKTLDLWGSSNAIDTNGNDVELAGPVQTRVAPSYLFTKTGVGTLTLSAPSPDFSGTLYANQGTISLASSAKLPNISPTGLSYIVDQNGVTNTFNRGGIAIETSARFILDNSLVNLSDRISPGVRVTMNPNATFRLIGAPGDTTTQTFGGLSLVAQGFASVSVVNGPGGTATLISTQPLSGPGTLFKDGSGTLEIQKVSSDYTGDFFVNAGRLVISDSVRKPNADVTLFNYNATLTLTASGSTSYPASVVGEFDKITAWSGSTFAVSPAGSTRKVTIAKSFDLASDGFTTDGTIDLTDTDMIVRNGDLDAVRSLLQSAYNNGARDGAGITSSVAGGPGNAAYTTLAVFKNNWYGESYFLTFDGIPVTSSDVLIKYTYFGDTNLDGVVDGADVKNAVEGYNFGLTGWYWGDFDYDNQVTWDEVTRLMQLAALNLPPLPNSGASDSGGTSTIPEPGLLAGVLPVAMLASRRRR